MCGFCGVWNTNDKKVNQDYLSLMSEKLIHRGPDDHGVWIDKQVPFAFTHRRLSILDLSSAGHQPMLSSCKRYILVYNGEIYNHLNLRKKIEERFGSQKWIGNSDTETLITSIMYYGIEKSLKYISGMFSIALWDIKKKELILARDRIGEKPLYYGYNNNIFFFGSELKSLLANPEFKAQINRDSVALQLRNAYIPAPYSIFKNIYKLLPGHYIKITQQDLKNNKLQDSQSYWTYINDAAKQEKNVSSLNIEIEQDKLEKILLNTVKNQMISDVPLGAFLSGGIDSSTIVALMQSASFKPIKTFTIGFNEDQLNEAKYAKAIANHLGTDHTELYVSSSDIINTIDQLPVIYDEPFSDSSQIPTILVSNLAKKNVSVSLSGDGGDELFSGYNRYKISEKFWNVLSKIPHPMRQIISSGIQSVPPKYWNTFSNLTTLGKKYNNFGDKMHKGSKVLESKNLYEVYYKLISNWENPTAVVLNSNEPNTLLTTLKSKLTEFNNQEKMMILDSLTYLPDDILVKVDRAGMSTSLETRMPFLDHELIEYVWKLPHSFKNRNGQGKWILRNILNKYVPKQLTNRSKMGFAIPIDTWLRGPLREWAENLLNERKIKQEGYLNANLVSNKWYEHLSGKRNWSGLLWNVLMFQSWIEKYKNKIIN